MFSTQIGGSESKERCVVSETHWELTEHKLLQHKNMKITHNPTRSALVQNSGSPKV